MSCCVFVWGTVVTRLLLWVGVVLLALLGLAGVWLSSGTGATDTDAQVEAFLARHWSHPLPPQGAAPQGYSELEASLAPSACGQCHAEQYRQWQGSLHSHAMGPGIQWQMRLADPATARSCLRCHAPLAEQFALLAQERGWSRSTSQPPAYVATDLHQQGLVCAACHVRKHQRFGPSARQQDANRNVHGGFVEHEAFGDSRFCATCHQFAEDGPRLNGKLREDAYNQWLGSRYAKDGVACQSCHMPERRHLWKGIHDPEMTRKALTTKIQFVRENETVTGVQAQVINTGAGHHFPTYLVPEVQVYLQYVDAEGKVTTLDRHIIGWRANVELTKEVFDQRLAVGEAVTLSGRIAAGRSDGQVRVYVRVLPRQQYVRTFEDYLLKNRRRLDAATRSLLQQAISEARAMEYDFIAVQRPLSAVAN